MGEKPTMLCSFYSFNPLFAATHAIPPSKLVLIIAKDSLTKEENKETVTKELKMAKERYAPIATVETVLVDGNDLMKIAEETIKLLDEDETKKVVNISGGWKLLAQGMLYGCYARPYRVSRIVCNDMENKDQIVDLPILSLAISNGKRAALAAIEKLCEKKEGKIEAVDVSKIISKCDVMSYQNLAELRESNYADENNRITRAGRIALLWKDEEKK